jgi:hypothetical protein
VPTPAQFETIVAVTMTLKPVTLTLNNKFNGQIDAVTGLVARIDGVDQSIDANSQITFTPATEAYVLNVVYKDLVLFNGHPASTTVRVLSVIRVDASLCDTQLLSATFGAQTGSVTCTAGVGSMYFLAPDVQTQLSITSAKFKPFTNNVNAPVQFETGISAPMELLDVTLLL